MGRLAAVAAVVLMGGCASTGLQSSLPTGREWSRALHGAVSSPSTWAPAVAAVAVAPWDDDVSDWAVRETPVFGSPGDAETASDVLLGATHAGMVVSALLVRHPDGEWRTRMERLVWEEVGVGLTGAATLVVKEATGRERPDRSDDLSFPSAHTSLAFASRAMALRNLRRIRPPPATGPWLRAGFTTLAVATGWARVEAGAHHPTDVLAGAALGNFVGVLIHDAFLGRAAAPVVQLEIGPDRQALTVHLRF